MSTRWWTLLMWALVAASALYWGLRLFVAPAPLPPQTQTAALGGQLRGDLSRLLGAEAPLPVAAATPEPVADARFQLIGVVSPRSSRAAQEGVALIAVDGKPAKAFRVGAVIDGETVLQGVGQRGATLGPRGGATAVALNLAPPMPAATGALPPAVSGGGTAFPQQPQAQQVFQPPQQRPMLAPPQLLPRPSAGNPNGPPRRLPTAQDVDTSAGSQSVPQDGQQMR